MFLKASHLRAVILNLAYLFFKENEKSVFVVVNIIPQILLSSTCIELVLLLFSFVFWLIIKFFGYFWA